MSTISRARGDLPTHIDGATSLTGHSQPRGFKGNCGRHLPVELVELACFQLFFDSTSPQFHPSPYHALTPTYHVQSGRLRANPTSLFIASEQRPHTQLSTKRACHSSRSPLCNPFMISCSLHTFMTAVYHCPPCNTPLRVRSLIPRSPPIPFPSLDQVS